MDKKSFVVKVSVRLAYLKAIFIHPENNTYPIFSIIVQKTVVNYAKKVDHDEINLVVQNLQVFDQTKYPETLDPFIEYPASEEAPEHEILGLNQAKVGEQGR